MRHIRLIALAIVFSCVAHAGWAIQYASIVIDTQTGKVLHAVNPDERAYPASLTKMMTLYLTFEALRDGRITLDTKFKVSALAEGRSPSKLGLRRGQTISVRDAIGGLVTKSANDVATVVAEALGRTEARFAERMTAKAESLGMTRTTFRNASGLPNRSQVTTARDMTKLALALQRDFPQYYRYFSLRSFEYRGHAYRNHNRLLGKYDGTDGIKTGYVHESGFNIVVSTEREGRRLIAVVLGGKTAAARDRHAMKLMDQAFAGVVDAPVVASASAPAKATAGRTASSGKTRKEKRARAPKKAPVAVASVKPAMSRAVLPVEPGSGWSVQVGAFNRFEPAQRAAKQAVGKVPGLDGARIAVVENDNDQLYRARLIGMSEKAARDTCRKLKSHKVGCMVVKTATEHTAVGDH